MLSKEECREILEAAENGYYTEIVKNINHTGIYVTMFFLKHIELFKKKKTISKKEVDQVWEAIDNLSDEELEKNIFAIGYLYGMAKEETICKEVLQEEIDLEALKQAAPGSKLLF